MPENRWGFEAAAWDAAKAEAKQVLGECARKGEVTAYSDFVRHIKSIQLEAHDPRLAHFLGEVSSEESAAGRGMLTALVVHKTGDYKPGPGFFELAQQLGHKVTDIDKFWIQELERVFKAWSP